MTDVPTLLRQAARCRWLARVCSTAAVARKFEALARDYEEHARFFADHRMTASSARAGEEPECLAPSSPAGPSSRRE